MPHDGDAAARAGPFQTSHQHPEFKIDDFPPTQTMIHRPLHREEQLLYTHPVVDQGVKTDFCTSAHPETEHLEW